MTYEQKKVILQQLEKFGLNNWYHNIEVIKGSGIFTQPNKPYVNYGRKFALKGIPEDYWKGKRVLDLGCFSGALSYALEDLGANVVAVDVMDPEQNGFLLIHKIRNSTVEFRRMSIYDLDPDEIGIFDVVAFTGLFYHLKHPLLAFDRINSVCKTDAYLITIGTSSDSWFHTDDTERCDNGFSFLKTITSEGNPLNDFPICGFSANQYYTDRSNWFIPNLSCLHGWHQASGFEVISEELKEREIQLYYPDETITMPRSIVEIIAKKFSDPIPEFTDDAYLRNNRDIHDNMQAYFIPTSNALLRLKNENTQLRERIKVLEAEKNA